MNNSELLAEVNANIRRLAAEVNPDDQGWEFACECGAEDCTEHLGLPLTRYDELKNAGAPLLAPGHSLTEARQRRGRAQRVRAEASALHDDATALKNQALHQQRRSRRIAENLDAARAQGTESEDLEAAASGEFWTLASVVVLQLAWLAALVVGVVFLILLL